MNRPPTRPLRAALGAFALGAVALAGLPRPAQAAWPDKPIKLLVGIAAGSVTDVVMRAVAQELSGRLGQTLLVDNRPGGNMVIGADACAKSPADGYTLCVLSVDALSTNPLTMEKLPYDPDRDFRPVTNLFFVREALIANAALAANSVEQLRAMAAGKPGTLNFGTLGPDSSPDLFLAWLKHQWNVDLTPVPYKGGGPIASALLAGEIDLSMMGMGNFVGGIQGGKLKALAIAAPHRVAAFPDVPTMAEAGLGAYPVRPWWGLVVPAGTPDAVVAKMSGEIVRLFGEAKFGEFMEARFLDSAAGTPEAFAAFLKADRERAAEVIRLARQTQRPPARP